MVPVDRSFYGFHAVLFLKALYFAMEMFFIITLLVSKSTIGH